MNEQNREAIDRRLLEAAVLVTGGSGFIGRRVIRRLVAQNSPVVAIYRHRLPETLDHVYPVCSDISSPELMAAPLRGVQTAVHLAWQDGLMGPRTSLSQIGEKGLTPNLRILANLVIAMERAGTQRIVLVSAKGASRTAHISFLQEKYLAEKMVLNSKIPEKIIIRSAVVFGDEVSDDRFINSMVRVMRFPFYPLPEQRESISPVHVDDLSKLIADATFCELAEPAAVVDINGGETYQVQDLFRLVSNRLIGKIRLPVKGVLGDSLLPLLERDKKTERKYPKLKDFLAISSTPDESIRLENPLVKLLPEDPKTFRSRFSLPNNIESFQKESEVSLG